MSAFKEFLEIALPVAQSLGPQCTSDSLSQELKLQLSESELRLLIRKLDDSITFFARLGVWDVKQWDILSMLVEIRKGLV